MSAAEFSPPRQRGITVHVILILVFSVIAALAAWQAFESQIGLNLTIFILVTGLFFVPLPFLVYRLYALSGAYYSLSRDRLRLRWGLRLEEIPVSDVEWVRSAYDIPTGLPRPRLRLPGSVLGTRRHPDLGIIEFLASDEQALILVATVKRIYAISPEDPNRFMEDFARSMEMGSLSPTSARSLFPSFVVIQAWESALARYLWLSGLFLNIGLLVWVSILIPTIASVPLGFSASGAPLDAVPSVRLILLPVVSIFLYMIGWITGLFFYRVQHQRMLSYILWISGTMMSLMFLVAILFLITTPA